MMRLSHTPPSRLETLYRDPACVPLGQSERCRSTLPHGGPDDPESAGPGSLSDPTPVWGRVAAALPALQGRVHADVCVVGLGGSGLSAVREARRLGLSVVGLEGVRVASGAAGRNGGFLLAGAAHFHHETRRRHDVALARRLYRLTEDHIAWMDAAESSVRKVGSVRIASDAEEERDIEEHLAALHLDGFEASRYEGPEGAGLCIPGDCVFDPVAWCSKQAASARAEGARLFEHSRATHVDRGLVATARGEVACRWVVVAIDADLGALLPELASSVTTWRLQMLATEAVPPVTQRAVYRRYGYDYYQQLPDGRLALGGGRDVGGVAERDTALATSTVVQDYLERLSREVTGTEPTIAHRWSGRVGYTDDGLPVADETRDGVFVVGGYSGTGNAIGMICGREAVSRFAGGPTPLLDVLTAMRD